MPAANPLKVLSSAPPPVDTLVVYTIITVAMLYNLPSWQNLDEVATVETFTKRLFPELLNVRQLAYIRLAIAAIMWATAIQFAMGPGVPLPTSYLPSSKLKTTIIPLQGWRALATFTCVSWMMLGMCFTLSGWIALQHSKETDSVVGKNDEETAPSLLLLPPGVSTWMLRAAMVCWTCSAPYTLLVSGVIKWVIWPQVLADGGTTEDLRCMRNKLMHNFNVLAAVSELALMGGLPVRWPQDIPTGLLFGCAYTAFSWCMVHSWNTPSKDGPQFLYFFVDTTLPGRVPTQCLCCLFGVLLIFMGIFSIAGIVLEYLPFGFLPHVVFVVGACILTMRFRDNDLLLCTILPYIFQALKRGD